MENKNFSCACIIMASGQGKRFGSNKLMADFLGEPLIAGILKVTENIFARRVIVTRHRDVENLCKSLGLEVVLHDKPHRNDTVRLGLEALEKNYTHYAFCMGDQPLVKKSSLERLLNKAQSKGLQLFFLRNFLKSFQLYQKLRAGAISSKNMLIKFGLFP